MFKPKLRELQTKNNEQKRFSSWDIEFRTHEATDAHIRLYWISRQKY